jgi:hypothetical protein
VVTGCAQPAGSKSIGVWDITYLGETDGTHRIAFRIEYSERGLPEDQEGFHDLSVIAYDRTLTEVARRSIGEVPSDINEDTRIELECSGFPFALTYAARESPCEESVDIKIAVYRGEDHGWIADQYRECNESLPPEISTVSE